MSNMKSPLQRSVILCASALFSMFVFSPAWAGAIPQKNVNIIGPTPINWLLAGNPRMQQNEPECAVSPNNPEWLACGFNDYRAVNVPGIGDAFPGIAMSRDSGRTWISGLHPGHLEDIPTINKKFGADANLEALPNLMLYNFIAGWRDDSQPGGVFVSRWYEHNREVGPPWEHLDTIQVDMGTSGRFLDKPAFDVAMYDPVLGMAPIQIPIPAYDDPRNLANSHPAYTLSVPAARAHLCYAVFVGNDNNDGTKINCLASDDGGQTWPVSSKISESVDINQGVSVATRNNGQDVLAVWRRFSDNNETSAIMYARSTNFGNTWAKAEVLTEFCAFDQSTGAARFRTNALPVAVSNGADFSVFFASRNNATETCLTQPKGKNKLPQPRMSPVSLKNDFDGPKDGEIRTSRNFSRIMMVRGTGGNQISWSTPVMVDPQLDGNGPSGARKPFHQFMPAAEVAGGIETVSWFDSRLDKLNLLATPIVSGFVEDSVLHLDPANVGSSGSILPAGLYDLVPPPPSLPPAEDNFPLRRNIDTFAAQIINGIVQPYIVDGNFYPDAAGITSNSVRVSRFATRQKPGGLAGEREQLEFNYPNGRLFRKGRAPFIGDYNSVFAAQFRQRQDSSWISNQTSPNIDTDLFSSLNPVFHVGWTSNHQVRGRVFYTGCDVWDESLQMWVASPTGCSSTYQDPTNPAMMLPLQGEDGSTTGPPGVCQAVAPGQKKPQPLTRNQNVYVAAMKPGVNVNIVSAIKFPDGIGFNTFVLDVQNGTQESRRVRLELPLPIDDPAVSFNKNGPLTEIVVDVPRGSGNARTVFDTANIIDNPPNVIVEVFDVTGLDPEDSATRGNGTKIARVPLLRESLVPLENVQNNDPDDLRDIIDPADGEYYNLILKREIGTKQTLDLENLDLENTVYMLDLENLDLENLDLENLDLENLDLENVVLFLDLENLDLENVDLGNLDLENALYEQLDLENLDLENLDLENLDLENLDLENRNLFYLDLENLDLENSVFAQLDLENLDLENLDLENLDLENLDLENLDLENFSIYASDLENLDLENLDLENTALGDEYTEISWTADSATNTTTGVDIKPIFSPGLAEQIAGTDTKVLLTVRQPYLTGTVLTNQAGAAPGLFCTPQVVAENQLVYAAILDADQINDLISDPDPSNPRTPSFVIEPDGSKIITLRFINPPPDLSIEQISRNTGLAIYSQAGGALNCDPEVVNSDDDILDCEVDYFVDEDPPVITLNGPASLSIEASPAGYIDAGASAFDEVDGTVTVVTVSNNVDTSALGTYSVEYFATDAVGNEATAVRNVTVVDTTPPVLSVPADITFEASGPTTAVPIGMATATDYIGPVTISSDTPTDFLLQSTDVTWTAVDGEGNASTGVQSVTVIDTTAPSIFIDGDNPQQLEASADPYVDPGFSAVDAVFGDLTSAIVVSGSVNPAVVGDYELTYDVTEPRAGGLSASAVRVVNVVDTQPPGIVFIPPDPVFSPPLDQPLPPYDPNDPAPPTLTAMWGVAGSDGTENLAISCDLETTTPTEVISATISATSIVYDPDSTSVTATFDYDFPAGLTTLQCTITDQGGAGQSTTSGLFTFVVEDTPFIEIVDPTVTVTTDGNSTAPIAEADLTSNINATDQVDGDLSGAASCAVVGETADPGTGLYDLSIGQYDVDCSVTDSADNPSATVRFTLDVIYPFGIVIKDPKGNINSGSALPIDFYFVDPPGSQDRVDASGIAVSAFWVGAYRDRNCTDDSDPDFGVDSGVSTGSSDFRYAASQQQWQFNWATPLKPGSYLFTVMPPGVQGGDPPLESNPETICVYLK